jgi:DNA-directed RNA polymerase
MQEFYMDDSKLFLASSYITKHTFASLKEMFLGARLIMDWLNQCARVISKTGLPGNDRFYIWKFIASYVDFTYWGACSATLQKGRK